MKHLAVSALASLAIMAVAAEAQEFKRVAPADVRNAPEKFQGRSIEFTNVNVYWVAENNVRILTGAGLMLLARNVAENDASAFFARECGTEDMAVSSRCRATVRFSFDRHDVDNPTGERKRTVLLSWDAELTRKR
jgi:hypothetical protein